MPRVFDRSALRRVSEERGVPIAELLLREGRRALGSFTLLGISPVSRYVVRAALLAAKELEAPVMFIASLNQVDVDGGYTGWTPKGFVEHLAREVEELGVEQPVIVALDHGGPWLKDRHVEEDLGLGEAMEAAKRSIEAALRAGYDVLHIDTTVEPGRVPDPETVARRTVKLIEFAEDVRRSAGLPPVSYEVGSDRWGLRDEESTARLIALVKRGLENRGVHEARLLFLVGDVGTVVRPSNTLDTAKAARLVKLAGDHGLFLKTHSTDFVENPEEFPRVGVGGANIGPEFAYRQYMAVKTLEEEARKVLGGEVGALRVVTEEILRDGRWRRYAGGRGLEELPENEKDFVLGISSRYVWSAPRVEEALRSLASRLSNAGVDAEATILNSLKGRIGHYMRSFGLERLAERIVPVSKIS
ncbi:MAG: hypothetical protein DRO39_02385 [Thermoprotei archaeon]|nr:MAG: hypothetical protein DRO39_02385 [Thermoprotei archaeon]